MMIIDREKLQDINEGHVFLTLPEDIEINGYKLTETIKRANASRRHLTSSHKNNDDISSNVRAALTEFCSMEGAVLRDLCDLDSEKLKEYKIYSSLDPLLIITKELRNYEVHLGMNSISCENESIVWGKRVDDPDALYREWSIASIDNLVWSDFIKLNNVSKIKSTEKLEDIKIAFEYFDQKQKEWGIIEIIYRAIVKYLDYISAVEKTNKKAT